MKVLVTGGCGFVGSNLAILIKEQYPSYEVVCMDNLKRRGAELSLSRLKAMDIEFVHGDIRIRSDFDFVDGADFVIDAAAEPSVLAGLNEGTEYVVDTNLNGTINCLNFAAKHKASFIFLSTSRVYPIATLEQVNYQETATRFELSSEQSIGGLSEKGVSEDVLLTGSRSIYGATKLASELMIEEYNQLLGVKTVVNRCGVITGPHQMGKVDQGVVVLWAARHFWNQELSYIGYGGQGKQVRDILHVHDLFRLVDWEMHHMDEVNGETFNAGGGRDCSVSLRELTSLCEKYTGNQIPISEVPETRVADLRIYLTDNTKVTEKTGWVPKKTPDEIIEEIVQWIQKEELLLKPILG